MAFSECGRYIVKQLSDGDHKSLIKVAKRYATHLTSGPSLLCLNVLHFEEDAPAKEQLHNIKGKFFRRRYQVMMNCLASDLSVYTGDASYEALTSADALGSPLNKPAAQRFSQSLAAGAQSVRSALDGARSALGSHGQTSSDGSGSGSGVSSGVGKPAAAEDRAGSGSGDKAFASDSEDPSADTFDFTPFSGGLVEVDKQNPMVYDCMYDLKGCNDDKLQRKKGKRVVEVHKRVWNLHMW